MSLQVIYKEVSSLIPYANNSRTHSESQIQQIIASIKEFGFTNPVLIDEYGGIIAGHGRVIASQKLGIDDIPTITLHGLSDAQRKAYVIADNKIADNASWNEQLLNQELESLIDMEFDFGDLLDLQINVDEAIEQIQYEPILNPTAIHKEVTDNDIKKANDSLEIKDSKAYNKDTVICPHCLEEFEIR